MWHGIETEFYGMTMVFRSKAHLFINKKKSWRMPGSRGIIRALVSILEDPQSLPG